MSLISLSKPYEDIFYVTLVTLFALVLVDMGLMFTSAIFALPPIHTDVLLADLVPEIQDESEKTKGHLKPSQTTKQPKSKRFLSHKAESVYRLHPDYKINHAEVLNGTRQSQKASVSWQGSSKKHRVEPGTIHYKMMKFLESHKGRATVAEIAAAVPTRDFTGNYLREMVEQEIIVQ